MNKQPPSLAAYLVPRLQDLLFIGLFYLVMLLGTNLIRDGDPGRHIVFGRYIIENLTIPKEDIFSYTMFGEFVPPYVWLTEVIFGGSYMLMGLKGIVLVSAFIISLTFYIIYLELLRRGTPKLLGFVLSIWAAIITMLHWLARPHLFTFFFLAIFTSLLARLTNEEKYPLWKLPVIMGMWVNMHGAFITGFITWGAFVAGYAWDSWKGTKIIFSPVVKRLILAGGLCLFATLINPSGIRLWPIILNYISNSYLVNLTSEYRSLDFHTLGAWPFLLTLVGTLCLLSRSQVKRPMAESLLLGGWAALGIYGARNVPLFAVVTMPMIAEHITPFFVNYKGLVKINFKIENLEKQLKGFLWSAGAVCLIIAILLSGTKLDAAQKGYRFNKVEFPVEALNWIEANPQTGNMFNYFPWGGYLIYRIWPNYKVFIDGQLFYTEEIIRDHQQIINAETGWQQTLDKYDIQWILIPTEARLTLVLPCESTWKLLYQDQTAVIFRRAQP